MHRVRMDPRPNWKKRLEELGIFFHTLHGETYWDETVAYQLSSFEVDTLELATNTLHSMCLEVVEDIIRDRDFNLFLIPVEFHDAIVRSWEQDEPSIYGRFDLAYDGVGSPKLLEYNADTPTALVEASVAQWHWLKDIDERGDQFNSIHEHLIDAWKGLRARDPGPIHFAAMSGQMEDYVTVEYLRDTAIQAGFQTEYLDVEQIGWDGSRRAFVDTSNRPMHRLFKLYPWEWMVREQFAPHILQTTTRWLEPAWKMLLSCKSILPILWEKYPDSPFLLPASFEPMDGDHVKKPVLAREGANITVVRNGRMVLQTAGPYGQGPFVYQKLAPLPNFEGRTPVFGSWLINGESCGVGIREGETIVTQNTSRFVPHQMVD